MRRWPRILVLLILAALLFSLCEVCAFADNGSTIVYRTQTGKCYHRGNCGYLHSKIEITLEEAVAAGLRPCSRCNPPILDHEVATPTPKPTAKPRTRSSDSNSGSVRYNRSSRSEEVYQREETTKQTEEKKGIIGFVCDHPVLTGIGAVFILLNAITIISEKREKAKLKAKKAAEQEKQRQEYESARAKYASLYGGKDPLTLASPPAGVCLKPDGLPGRVSGTKWGEGYTVYVTGSGKSFHRICGCSGARAAINVTRIGYRTPCQRCKPIIPDLRWYNEYCKIVQIKEKYQIN